MINSFIHRTFLAVLVMLVPVSNAVSEADSSGGINSDISFDYVQATFALTTVDPGDSVTEADGTGFGFSLSLGINKYSAFILSVISTTFDTFQGIEVESSKLTTYGFTAHTLIAPSTEVYANLSLAIANATVPESSSATGGEDYGGVFGVGLRYLVTDKIELELGGSNIEVFDTSVFSYNLETRIYFRKVYSLGVGYVSSENADSFQFHIRMDI